MLTAEYVRSRLDYDPQTGIFLWRHADPQPWKGWNSKYAGGRAGTVNRAGYRAISLGYMPRLEHRLAWLCVTGEWPAALIDHINGVRDDNRWSNLRLATKSQNFANSDTARSARGVWPLKSGRFRAQIKVNGVARWLGSFATEEEARAAYLAAAEERDGEFRRTA